MNSITVEFTDITSTFSYNGSALNFNTAPAPTTWASSTAPPNNEGYFVTAAKE